MRWATFRVQWSNSTISQLLSSQHWLTDVDIIEKITQPDCRIETWQDIDFLIWQLNNISKSQQTEYERETFQKHIFDYITFLLKQYHFDFAPICLFVSLLISTSLAH